MTRETVIQRLREHQEDLGAIGVRHAAVFGSVARGDDRFDSDIDIVVDVDPQTVRTIVAMGKIQMRLQALLGRPVDVAQRAHLRPQVAAEVDREAINAF